MKPIIRFVIVISGFNLPGLIVEIMNIFTIHESFTWFIPPFLFAEYWALLYWPNRYKINNWINGQKSL